jgi:hypothetical protein
MVACVAENHRGAVMIFLIFSLLRFFFVKKKEMKN